VVEAYPSLYFPIQRSFSADRHLLRMTLVRNQDCDSIGKSFFLAAGDSRCLVQVIDNGPGVDDPDRIFDAFMTTKEKGMGIGLAVSRSIVETHGGAALG
jgi:nitrogen fixation/metabolism regulation signal transduction histidine kinase